MLKLHLGRLPTTGSIGESWVCLLVFWVTGVQEDVFFDRRNNLCRNASYTSTNTSCDHLPRVDQTPPNNGTLFPRLVPAPPSSADPTPLVARASQPSEREHRLRVRGLTQQTAPCAPGQPNLSGRDE
jgi:hypothetical protein